MSGVRRLRVVRETDAANALAEALAGGDAVLVRPDAAARPGPALRSGDVGGTVTPPGVGAPVGKASVASVPAEVDDLVAVVVETSGSTGTPKLVALSAEALYANTAASAGALGGPGQWVLALPTHYIAGINVLARSIAAGTVPVATPAGRFTVEGFLDAARRLEQPHRFTALVPAQLATLLDDERTHEPLRGFQRILVGGQATPAPLVDRARELGIAVTRSYGSSETAGGCVYDGRPIGDTVVRVEDGEVWLGGPSIAEGYLGDDALTAARFVELGGIRHFRTSDAGALGDVGLVVTGRRDGVIVSGGVKVSLGEIERMLREHPALPDAVVVAAPDARWGEVPVAFTVSRDDPAPAIAAAAAELGVAARPARVIRLPELPLLPSGKPDRRALMALAVS